MIPAVLYTLQLEPITVIDVPPGLYRRLCAGEVIRFAAQFPLPRVLHPRDNAPVNEPYCRTVAVFGEKLAYRGHESLMLFTDDEETALLLRASFLPGQRGAFVDGFIRALYAAGGGL